MKGHVIEPRSTFGIFSIVWGGLKLLGVSAAVVSRKISRRRKLLGGFARIKGGNGPHTC